MEHDIVIRKMNAIISKAETQNEVRLCEEMKNVVLNQRTMTISDFYYTRADKELQAGKNEITYIVYVNNRKHSEKYINFDSSEYRTYIKNCMDALGVENQRLSKRGEHLYPYEYQLLAYNDFINDKIKIGT